MKQFIITIIAMALAFSLQAQKARVGFTAGLNYSSLATKADFDRSFKPGLAAGLITELEFGKLCVAPAIYYSQKGFMNKTGNYGASIKERLNLNYIELPVNFLYKANTGMNSWFVGAGPYIATAIESIYKMETEGEKILESIRFGNTQDDDLRAFDAGVNVLAGYRWKNGLYASVNYTRGFYNMNPMEGNDFEKLFNQVFGLKLGYFFKGLND